VKWTLVLLALSIVLPYAVIALGLWLLWLAGREVFNYIREGT
jgi:hypothetical protein